MFITSLTTQSLSINFNELNYSCFICYASYCGILKHLIFSITVNDTKFKSSVCPSVNLLHTWSWPWAYCRRHVLFKHQISIATNILSTCFNIQSNPDSMKFRGPNLLFHIMRVSYYLGSNVNAQLWTSLTVYRLYDLSQCSWTSLNVIFKH